MWATAGALGFVEDPDSIARFLAVVLCMPWTLAVFLMIWISQIETWLLGYSFYAESPNWMFEPLWLVFCVVAVFLNARIISRLTRLAALRTGPSGQIVPLGLLGFFGVIVLIFRW
ncbi:hypothetical protein DVK44_08070 [Streptomyces paludis]|uniref:Uncharacterized protein n=1 Tax=Streptomyces paludis TaxID=2282738 RepID=A0A345HLT6_9ACTN|nr:hypothetical protein DVK44_08070 [Streptomyces paludis]